MNDGNGWIWINDWNEQVNQEPVIVYFRKAIEFKELPEKMNVKITADSRYKLYINGTLVEVGPQKGDNKVWYYDTLNLLPFLKPGSNVFLAVVLRYPDIHNRGNHSIYRTHTPGFYLDGFYKLEKDISFLADKTWKAHKAKVKILSENDYFAPLQILEEATSDKEIFGMMDEDFNDSNWQPVFEYNNKEISKVLHPGNLLERKIPYLYRKKHQFEKVYCLRNSNIQIEDWDNLLKGRSKITIPANSKEIIEISAGEETTAYLHLALSGGKESNIRILTSECYAYEPEEDHDDISSPKKGDRTDFINGRLYGFTDTYDVYGAGTISKPEVYETFWFRTFRFIQLSIETGSEPLTIVDFHYEQTGYPLKVETKVKTSDRSLDKVWEISERTLRCCMHETYEDGPFYEQLQYAMDSRSQILYTYAISADDRLARQCMDDFKRSFRFDGMINCSYPNYEINIIPGFSIYYIGMVYDHMMYFGDRDLVLEHIPSILGILDYFKKNLNKKGIVGKIGGPIYKEKFWSFIDWTEEWKETVGVPLATYEGPITMESFLYILGLQYASELLHFVEYNEFSKKLLQDADEVKKAVNKNCRGKNGMYKDGPDTEHYSQHCQVFAILTGTISIEEGRDYLKETFKRPELYAQCSVAMMYYLFRALEVCELYQITDQLWNIWRDMVDKNLTTCVEDPVNGRSDCHAWGSLILYELPSVTLGVRPTAPGFKKMEISLIYGYFDWAEGKVKTPRGFVEIKWKKEEDKSYVVEARVPQGIVTEINGNLKNTDVKLSIKEE